MIPLSHWLKAPLNPILMILAALSNENAGKNCTPNKLGFTKMTTTFELICKLWFEDQISCVSGPTKRTLASTKHFGQNAGNNAIFPDLGGSIGKAQTNRKFTRFEANPWPFFFTLRRRIQETHPSMWRCTGSQLTTRLDCASGKDELCQSSTEVIRVQLSQCVTKILEISRSLALWLARRLDPYSSDPNRMSNRPATILPIPFQLV